MSWVEHHKEIERYAADAELAARQGVTEQVINLYSLAARAETQALSELDLSKKRTLGITVVSAVALWYKAHDYSQAERLAHQWLATDVLPDFATDQLEDLLRRIWNARLQNRAGVRFIPGEFSLAVKGGEIVTGGAPLDLIIRKTDEIRALLYRTTEFLMMAPHRKRGGPSPAIQEVCRPWLFQETPSSYRFAVRMQEPAQQLTLFPEEMVQIEKILPTFLSIVRATADDPDDALQEIVPDTEYRVTFLKLMRNLAPTGRGFSRLDLESESIIGKFPIVLLPGSRDAINRALRKHRIGHPEDSLHKEVQLLEILRGLHLDEDWLEIAVENVNQPHTIRIYEAGETVDDLVGPMVNHEVIIDAFVTRNGKYLLRDIQAVE